MICFAGGLFAQTLFEVRLGNVFVFTSSRCDSVDLLLAIVVGGHT